MRTLFTFFCLLALAVSVQAVPVPITTYAQMTAQLHSEATKSPLVRVMSLGKSAGGMRDIWLVRLADPASDPAQTKRLLVLCRQHGDEPASTEALLRLIQNISSGGDPTLKQALTHVTLYVIPMVNPDGAEAGTRVNSRGADLNRDWGVFKQPETRAIAAAIKDIRPALVVDAHNWDGDDEYNADCIEIPRQMQNEPGQDAHALQQQAIHDLSRSGYAVHPTAWGDDANPALAHRWLVHEGTPSLLVETHYGPPSNRADFEAREGLYSALLHSLARRSDAPWLHQSMVGTQEASLFPILGRNASVQPVPLPRKHSVQWLWAFGLPALAAWGMSLRNVQQVRKRSSWSSLPPSGRYSYRSKS